MTLKRFMVPIKYWDSMRMWYMAQILWLIRSFRKGGAVATEVCAFPSKQRHVALSAKKFLHQLRGPAIPHHGC